MVKNYSFSKTHSHLETSQLLGELNTKIKTIDSLKNWDKINELEKAVSFGKSYYDSNIGNFLFVYTEEQVKDISAIIDSLTNYLNDNYIL